LGFVVVFELICDEGVSFVYLSLIVVVLFEFVVDWNGMLIGVDFCVYWVEWFVFVEVCFVGRCVLM